MIRIIPIKTSVIVYLLALILLLQGSAASAQAIGHIYAPRPPAGSTFVRVVNPEALSLSVRIGSEAPEDQLSSEAQVATIYRIVRGDEPLNLEINGKSAEETLRPPPDRFVTLVLRAVKDQYQLKMIVEDTALIDGLRADLRFYNMISGCMGGLSVVDGPQVFEPIPTETSRHLSINPVEANLISACSKTRSSVWTLPPLQPGDHYSLFLIGGPDGPKLVGQLDQTEPYHGPVQ